MANHEDDIAIDYGTGNPEAAFDDPDELEGLPTSDPNDEAEFDDDETEGITSESNYDSTPKAEPAPNPAPVPNADLNSSHADTPKESAPSPAPAPSLVPNLGSDFASLVAKVEQADFGNGCDFDKLALKMLSKLNISVKSREDYIKELNTWISVETDGGFRAFSREAEIMQTPTDSILLGNSAYPEQGNAWGIYLCAVAYLVGTRNPSNGDYSGYDGLHLKTNLAALGNDIVDHFKTRDYAWVASQFKEPAENNKPLSPETKALIYKLVFGGNSIVDGFISRIVSSCEQAYSSVRYSTDGIAGILCASKDKGVDKDYLECYTGAEVPDAKNPGCVNFEAVPLKLNSDEDIRLFTNYSCLFGRAARASKIVLPISCLDDEKSLQEHVPASFWHFRHIKGYCFDYDTPESEPKGIHITGNTVSDLNRIMSCVEKELRHDLADIVIPKALKDNGTFALSAVQLELLVNGPVNDARHAGARKQLSSILYRFECDRSNFVFARVLPGESSGICWLQMRYSTYVGTPVLDNSTCATFMKSVENELSQTSVSLDNTSSQVDFGQNILVANAGEDESMKLSSGGKAHIYSFVATTNRTVYTTLPTFANKPVRRYIEGGITFSERKILVGKDMANTDVFLDLSKYAGIRLYATSRSGKGVMCLAILAALLASGCNLVYADAKPDMSILFWKLTERLNQEYRALGGTKELKFLSCEFLNDRDYKTKWYAKQGLTKPPYDFTWNTTSGNATINEFAHEILIDADARNMLGSVSVSLEDCMQYDKANLFGVLAYMKFIYLTVAFSQSDLFDKNKDKPFVIVCDECNAMLSCASTVLESLSTHSFNLMSAIKNAKNDIKSAKNDLEKPKLTPEGEAKLQDKIVRADEKIVKCERALKILSRWFTKFTKTEGQYDIGDAHDAKSNRLPYYETDILTDLLGSGAAKGKASADTPYKLFTIGQSLSDVTNGVKSSLGSYTHFNGIEGSRSFVNLDLMSWAMIDCAGNAPYTLDIQGNFNSENDLKAFERLVGNSTDYNTCKKNEYIHTGLKGVSGFWTTHLGAKGDYPKCSKTPIDGNSEVRVFKSYLILNANDFTPHNPLDEDEHPYTGGTLGRVKSIDDPITDIQSAKKDPLVRRTIQDLLMPDANPNWETGEGFVTDPTVGFDGLIELLSSSLDKKAFCENYGAIYDRMMVFLNRQTVGVKRYSSLEEYIYDFSYAGLMLSLRSSNAALIQELQGGDSGVDDNVVSRPRGSFTTEETPTPVSNPAPAPVSDTAPVSDFNFFGANGFNANMGNTPAQSEPVSSQNNESQSADNNESPNNYAEPINEGMNDYEDPYTEPENSDTDAYSSGIEDGSDDYADEGRVSTEVEDEGFTTPPTGNVQQDRNAQQSGAGNTGSQQFGSDNTIVPPSPPPRRMQTSYGVVDAGDTTASASAFNPNSCVGSVDCGKNADNLFAVYRKPTKSSFRLLKKELTKKFLKQIASSFGGYDAVVSLEEQNEIIYINKQAFTPVFDDDSLLLSGDAIKPKLKSGKLASLIDFHSFKVCKNLSEIIIGTQSIADYYFWNSTGISPAEPTKIKKIWRKIRVFRIAGNDMLAQLTPEEEKLPKAEKMSLLKQRQEECESEYSLRDAGRSFAGGLAALLGLPASSADDHPVLQNIGNSKPVRAIRKGALFTAACWAGWGLLSLANPFLVLGGIFTVGAYISNCREDKKKGK